MGVPRVYRTAGEGSIISFNFTDIAEGTGIVIYYGYATETSGGNDYHLTTQSTIYSTEIDEIGASVTAVDRDFDLSVFNIPAILKGTALVSFTIGARSGTGTTTQSTAVVTIRKVTTAGETDIVSVTSPTVTAGASATVLELMTVPLTVPKTHFKKGDTLRLNITVTPVRAAGSQGAEAILGHDPRNRDGSFITPSTDSPDTITQVIFHAPFDIQR